jgi:hypothetical protein
MDDRGRARADGAEPPPVDVQPVVARISVLALGAGRPTAGATDGDEPGLSASVEWMAPSQGDALTEALADALADALPWGLPSSEAVMRPMRQAGLLAVAASFGVALATRDARLGLAGGALVGLWTILRSIDRHVTFSFGSGFVGYRPDMGWPRGVQEEDGVRWRLHPRSRAAAGNGSRPT